MKIAIVACETFKRCLDELIKNDEDIIHVEYLEFGLHEYPDELRSKVIEKVNSLRGQVDSVFLGYGICNSLKDITMMLNMPTVTLQADDCIGVMITTKEYDLERKKCAGTMYHTPYFAQMGKDWFERKMREKVPNYEELGIDLDWYMGKLFDGYSRVLFIDDGLPGIDEYITMSKMFADEMKLNFDIRSGTLMMLSEGIGRAKDLARASSK